MITAMGGITSAHAEITTAAVTEYSRTTVHARTIDTMHTPIKMKYSRSRTQY
jgi:hypothetical protein